MRYSDALSWANESSQRIRTYFSSIGADLIRPVAGPAVMAKLAVRVEDRSTAVCAALDELCPAQYTKEMAFQDMGKVATGWTETILVFLFVFANHRKSTKRGRKNALCMRCRV